MIDPVLSIPAFYSGRSILITGVTGYLGKALLEKLLRSCPDTREIFLLIRPSKNFNINERLQRLLTNSLFDKLRSERPQCFEKLIPVKSDITVKELGLSSFDRDMLIERTSIIFHVAATIKFDDTLKNCLLTNVKGTRDICILGERMKNLRVLVHVSTTYSQIDKPIVEEIIYPIEIDWKKSIQIAESLDERMLQTFALKYIDKMPNNYTFSKRLAEQVVTDYSGSVPCIICRPSVVTPTLNEPVKGWLDNFNGPVGMLIGGGKGIVRIFYGDPTVCDNNIPIDIVVKAMLVTAWKHGSTSDIRGPVPLVYNCAANHTSSVSRQETNRIGFNIMKNIPYENTIWAPSTIIINSSFFYNLFVIPAHVIPALFIDALLKMAGKRPRLMKLQRNIYITNKVLLHFVLNEWNFRNQRLLNLSDEIPLNDQETFGFAVDLNDNYDKTTYFTNCVIGSKVYLLRESMDRLDATRLSYKRMIWIDRIIKTIIFVFFIWTMFEIGR